MVGHLVDLLLNCLLDEFGLLHFNCVDDVLNVRVDKLLRLLSDRHLNDLSSK